MKAASSINNAKRESMFGSQEEWQKTVCRGRAGELLSAVWNVLAAAVSWL